MVSVAKEDLASPLRDLLSDMGVKGVSHIYIYTYNLYIFRIFHDIARKTFVRYICIVFA